MLVREVMTTKTICCTESFTVQRAVRLMQESDTGFFGREVVGVVTDRDLCVRGLAEGGDSSQLRISEFMTADPVVCTPDTDVTQALVLMAGRRIRRILVVDKQNVLQGIVSLADLIRHNAIDPQDMSLALTKITAPKARGCAAT